MKLLNYLPLEIAERRRLQVLTIISSVAVTLILIVIVLLYVQVEGISKEITEKQELLSLTTELESDIIVEELKLQGSIHTDRVNYTNVLELNRLLGVILTQTPQDVVINTIFTETELQRSLALTPKEAPEPTEELDSANQVEEVATEQKEQAEMEEPVEQSTELYQDIPVGDNVYDEPQSVMIRGTAFDLQSISSLATILKNETYVKSVELSPIENYNDGYFNHKLFELKIILVGGE